MFAYRLAAHVGRVDVGRMLHEMTARQLFGWMAYYQADPFGGERGDLHAGILKHAILNTMGRGPDDDPIPLEDCIPRFAESESERERRERQKQRQMKRKIKDVLGRF